MAGGGERRQGSPVQPMDKECPAASAPHPQVVQGAAESAAAAVGGSGGREGPRVHGASRGAAAEPQGPHSGGRCVAVPCPAVPCPVPCAASGAAGAPSCSFPLTGIYKGFCLDVIRNKYECELQGAKQHLEVSCSLGEA